MAVAVAVAVAVMVALVVAVVVAMAVAVMVAVVAQDYCSLILVPELRLLATMYTSQCSCRAALLAKPLTKFFPPLYQHGTKPRATKTMTPSMHLCSVTLVKHSLCQHALPLLPGQTPKPRATKAMTPSMHFVFCVALVSHTAFDNMPTTIFWTDYVATRWYRAPELCGSFFAKYTSAIDVWCVQASAFILGLASYLSLCMLQGVVTHFLALEM